MAFTFDAKVESNATSTGLTVSHTTAVGANLLVLGIAIRGNQTVTATYAGVSLVMAVERVDASDPERTALMYLVSPATGANNLIVSLSGSVLHYVTVATFTAGGTPSLEVTASAEQTASTNASVTLPASTGGLAVDCCSTERAASPPFISAGGDQTVLHNTGSGSYGRGSSYELAPASGETFNWDQNLDPNTWVHVAAVFTEGAAAGQLVMADSFQAIPFM